MNPAISPIDVPLWSDELDALILRTWRKRLGSTKLGMDDSFLSAGGDSLAAMLLLADIELVTGRRLDRRTMITAPTVRAQLALLRNEVAPKPGDDDPFLTTVRSAPGKPGLFLIPGYGDALIGIRTLAQMLDPDQSLQILHPAGFDPATRRPRSLTALAQTLIESMKRVQPVGPWHLAGHLLGAHVAWAIAVELARRGEPMGALILLDSNAPGYPVRRARPVRAAMKLVVAARQGPGAVTSLVKERFRRGLGDLLPGPASMFDNVVARELGPAAREHEQRWRRVLKLADRYTHLPWPGRVHLVRGSVRVDEIGVRDDDPACGWRPLAGRGVRVLPITSDHTSILLARHAPALADLIAHCLHEANSWAQRPALARRAEGGPTSTADVGPLTAPDPASRSSGRHRIDTLAVDHEEAI